MSKNVLITGATGNIGSQVIKSLSKVSKAQVIAGVRDIEKANSALSEYQHILYRKFDFENQFTHQAAFNEIDILFLLRPPHISDVKHVFEPLLENAQKSGIKQVIFLSVQGVEKSKVIPHNKIERLIQKLGFQYIFVRPGYFMQNLTTTLLEDIQVNSSITLPSAKATFNWIDVNDIGECTAKLIQNFEAFKNEAYEITGLENLNFYAVSDVLSSELRKKIVFNPVNPIRFYFLSTAKGLPHGFAFVMTLLHFLPRVQKEPQVSQNVEMLTGHRPTTIRDFIKRERNLFLSNSN